MEVARDFRPLLVTQCFMAQDDPIKLNLVRDEAAAMVGEARVVVADDPRPLEGRGQSREQCARARIESVAAEAVVETVAEAVEPLGAGALDLAGKRGQRGVRIIGRKE